VERLKCLVASSKSAGVGCSRRAARDRRLSSSMNEVKSAGGRQPASQKGYKDRIKRLVGAARVEQTADSQVSTTAVKPSKASGAAVSKPACRRTAAIERWSTHRD